MTLTVLGVSLFFALYVGIIDLGLSEGIKYLSERGIINNQSGQSNTIPNSIDVEPVTVPIQ